MVDELDVTGQALTGQTSSYVKVHSLTPVTTTIETVTYSNGDVVERICHFSEINIYKAAK